MIKLKQSKWRSARNKTYITFPPTTVKPDLSVYYLTYLGYFHAHHISYNIYSNPSMWLDKYDHGDILITLEREKNTDFLMTGFENP